MATGKGAGRKIDLRSKHYHWRVTITYSDKGMKRRKLRDSSTCAASANFSTLGG